jgi:hypothetical protein
MMKRTKTSIIGKKKNTKKKVENALFGKIAGKVGSHFWSKEKKKINDSIKEMKDLIGEENIISVLLYGGAARHVTGTASFMYPKNQIMRGYKDIDLMFIMSKKGMDKLNSMKEGKVESLMEDNNRNIHRIFNCKEFLENKKQLSNPVVNFKSIFNIHEGIPIYKIKEGSQIRKNVMKIISKGIKDKKLSE